MRYCPHWDSTDEVDIAGCNLCSSAEAKPRRWPDPLVVAEQRKDRGKNRNQVRYNRCPGCGGAKERHNRLCLWCTDENTLAAATAVDEFLAGLDRRDRKELAFSANLAADRAARRYHTAYTGLYPDDPYLAARVPEAK